jgi:hypothetical protein
MTALRNSPCTFSSSNGRYVLRTNSSRNSLEARILSVSPTPDGKTSVVRSRKTSVGWKTTGTWNASDETIRRCCTALANRSSIASTRVFCWTGSVVELLTNPGTASFSTRFSSSSCGFSVRVESLLSASAKRKID